MTFFLIILYLLISGFSAVLVTHGLETSGQYHNIFSKEMIFVFVMLLQVSISLGLLYIDTCFKQKKYIVGMFIIFLCSALVVFEMFHALAIQTKASQGHGLVGAEISQLQTVATKINHANASISNTYDSTMNRLDKSWKDSKSGLDTTGIARCESICKSRILKYEEGSKFADIADHIILESHVDENDLASTYIQLKADYDILKSRELRFNEFTDAIEEQTPVNITNNIIDIGKVLEEKQPLYDGEGDVTVNSLALNETLSIIANVWSGNLKVLNGRNILSMFYSIIPFFVLLSFKSYMTVIDYERNPSLEQLKDDLNESEAKTRLRKRIMQSEIGGYLYEQATKGKTLFNKMFQIDKEPNDDLSTDP